MQSNDENLQQTRRNMFSERDGELMDINNMNLNIRNSNIQNLQPDIGINL